MTKHSDIDVDALVGVDELQLFGRDVEEVLLHDYYGSYDVGLIKELRLGRDWLQVQFGCCPNG